MFRRADRCYDEMMDSTTEMLGLLERVGDAGGLPWQGLPSSFHEPAVSTLDLSRQSARAVGQELWSTTSEEDFKDCLASLIEQDAPSFWPLLEHLLLQLPRPQQTLEGVMQALTPRVAQVFGLQAVGVFFAAVAVTIKAFELSERGSERKMPRPSTPPLSFYDPSYPPSLRKAVLGGQKAAYCFLAVLDTMLRGEHVTEPQSFWVLSTWLVELKLYVRMMAVLLGDKTTLLLREELVPSADDILAEGRAANARLETLFGGRPVT